MIYVSIVNHSFASLEMYLSETNMHAIHFKFQCSDMTTNYK